MQVILKENVSNLGQIGDVVTVSPGFARNFLIPRALVEPASRGNIKQVEHRQRILDKKRQEVKKQAEGLAQKLSDLSCTITRKVGEKDRLFGSVTSADISSALRSLGHEIDKKDVHLPEPLRTIGVHPVEISVHPEVKAEIKVWIAKQED